MSNVVPSHLGQSSAATFALGRLIELATVLIILLSLTGLLAARLHKFHAIPIWLVCLLATYAYARWTAHSPPTVSNRTPVWHIILIVGIGLIFRLAPFDWILGGQDQGVYVNMAMELARTGSLAPTDQVIAQINDPAFLQLYKKENYGSAYLPGVYSTRTGLVFQFYHLFPVWMALFAFDGEPGYAVYALTFLSIISLLAFYRLALLVSRSEKIALTASLLLALNPLHAFFSKFPVTEVPTLGFSLLSFVFLLTHFFDRGEGDRGTRYLWISVGAMGLLFLTRISGFMYIPFVYALSLIAVILVDDKRQKYHLLLWCAAVLFVYALSVWYGLKWSRPYSMDIYRLSFERIFAGKWLMGLVVLALVASASWLVVWIAARRDRALSMLRRSAAVFGAMLPYLCVVFVVIGLYKAYKLGFTDAYAQNPWEGQRWRMSHQGWRSVFSTSLVATAVYLSPFLWIALFMSAFLVRQNLMRLLLLFIAPFVAYVGVLQWFVPYQPYYARYLLSELVPYAILFVSCAWGLSPRRQRARVALGWALVLGAFWMSALSLLQLGKREHSGVSDSFERLSSDIDDADLIVIETPLHRSLHLQAATTLTYVKGFNVIRATSESANNRNYLDFLASKYDDVYIFTDSSANPPAGAEKVRSVRFQQDSFLHNASPPIAVDKSRDRRIDVYRYEPRRVPFFNGIMRRAVDLVSGWSTPERWGTWTNDKTARLTIDTKIFHEDPSLQDGRIEVRGHLLQTDAHPSQRVTVLVDGTVLVEDVVTLPRKTFSFTIPVSSLADRDVLQVEFRLPDAVSPKAIGLSGDPRELAFGLESIRVVK